MPISGVHLIMMEKLALAGGRGGARSPLSTLVTLTYKATVYAPAERADTLNLFHLYCYMYFVVRMVERNPFASLMHRYSLSPIGDIQPRLNSFRNNDERRQ